MLDSTIDETGFTSKVTNIREDSFSNIPEPDNKVKNSRFMSFENFRIVSKIKLLIISLLSIFLCIFLYLSYQKYFKETPDEETSNSSLKFKNMQIFDDKPFQNSNNAIPDEINPLIDNNTLNPSIQQSINNNLSNSTQIENAVSLKLQNYFTKNEIELLFSKFDNASKNEKIINRFSLEINRNKEYLEDLERNSANDLTRMNMLLLDLKSSVMDLKNDIYNIKETLKLNDNKIVKLEKNSGWFHNRINTLESNSLPKNTDKASPHSNYKSSLTNKTNEDIGSPWVVNGATNNLAFISNIRSGKKLRVTIGFDIPGCGKVNEIDPRNKKITTTTCSIFSK